MEDAGVLLDLGVAPSKDTGPDPDQGTIVARDAGSTEDASSVDLGEPKPPRIAQDCDPLVPAHCALPWPSNLYLAPANTPTGVALQFSAGSLPRNDDGDPIDPTIFDGLDGYGLGPPIIVSFDNLDFSGLADEEHIEASLAEDAKILLFEVQESTMSRVPYFAELDSRGTDGSRLLYVRPAQILKEASRYIVAFRGLNSLDGAPVQTSTSFEALKRNETSDVPELAWRQEGFNDVFDRLQAQGVERAPLQLAWDFRTGSSAGLHGRMLHMRDDAFAAVGPDGPPLTIEDIDYPTPAENPDIAFEIRAELEVPSYLRRTLRGTRLRLDDQGRPERQRTRRVDVWIRVPRSAVETQEPHALVQFGHGLLQRGNQVEDAHFGRLANQHRFILFACDLDGMSRLELIAVFGLLGDLTRFPVLADTLHQGLLNYLLLARSMKQQFASLPQIQALNLPIGDQMYYFGVSQGGIFGASYMALSQDIVRGHLGVPGNNYSTMLGRSVDFEPFFAVLERNYETPAAQAVALAAVQLLWDRTDPISYYQHLSIEPFAQTPMHQVLAAPVKGDHQVPPVTMENLARSNLGIPILERYDDERAVPLIQETPYPHQGSGIVLWDFGNSWAPPGNVPPHEGEDPHALARQFDVHNAQMATFFRTGEIVDVCGGDGCHPD